MGSTSALTRLQLKVAQGDDLLSALAAFAATPGCDKLARKVRAELKFLKKLQKKPHTLKEDHLRSSNMDSLAAVVARLAAAADVTAILATFPGAQPGERSVVDVVADAGATWIKVISRNPRALQRVSLGQGEFGQKSVLDQAEEYLAAARRSPHYFQPPTVQFAFAAGVGCGVAERLTALGVHVVGEWIGDDRLGVVAETSDDDSDADDAGDDKPDLGGEVADSASQSDALRTEGSSRSAAVTEDASPNDAAEPALNLDVTALLAYVSNLTNGRCNVHFSEPVLAQQAAWERVTPVKRQLDAMFRGHKLYCCRSAERDFVAIVNTVGGAAERRRADALLRRLTVVDDLVAPTTALLRARGKVRQRSAAVFGTGEALRVPTVTANSGFVRAAAGQGVRLTALTHGSRALTEAKEGGALREGCEQGAAAVAATEHRQYSCGNAVGGESEIGSEEAVTTKCDNGDDVECCQDGVEHMEAGAS